MNSSYNSDGTVATTWGRLKMTMSVSYTVFDGEIVSENRGGLESIYVPDTLGSTVAIISTGGVITDTFTYWPFGEIQTHVGSSVTPFTYVGTLGYYTDIGSVSIYVRARHYRPALTRWQTVDPLWPYQQSYTYADASPTLRTDYWGLCGGPGTTTAPAKPAPEIPPDWFSHEPTRYRPPFRIRGGALPVAATCQACILAAGALACWELCHYSVGNPSGPLTQIGENIGKRLFPDPPELPPVNARPWKCTASCGTRGPTPPCGTYLTGSGTGSNQETACRAAKRSAVHELPQGSPCSVGHCKCSCVR